MQMRRSGMLAVTGAAALLAGCAANRIRLDTARTVTATSTAATTAARSYFADVEARRMQAAAAIVASDPSCVPASPLLIQVPDAVGDTPPAPLCVGPAGPAPGYTAYPIDIGQSPRAIIEPRIETLTAIADYTAALAEIVDEPASDVSTQVTAFADQIDRIGRFADFVGGRDLPSGGAVLATEQGQSLTALIVFAAELAREARDARRVRAIVLARGDVVDRALASLKTQVTVWGRGRAAGADDLFGNALFRSYMRDRATLTTEQREVLAARIFAARTASREAGARAQTVGDAIDLAQRAQAGLRDALAGRLTAAQRRAAARMNIDRLTKALGLIAGLATPV
ncbi:MAG TPA: hypothetical protein VF649_09085 [Sphingomonas sp.]|uniref:hypothetical protein n=1 Tax=Sphingomonas sp. TaxID=28214 RepID=UPI002ED8A783